MAKPLATAAWTVLLALLCAGIVLTVVSSNAAYLLLAVAVLVGVIIGIAVNA